MSRSSGPFRFVVAFDILERLAASAPAMVADRNVITVIDSAMARTTGWTMHANKGYNVRIGPWTRASRPYSWCSQFRQVIHEARH